MKTLFLIFNVFFINNCISQISYCDFITFQKKFTINEIIELGGILNMNLGIGTEKIDSAYFHSLKVKNLEIGEVKFVNKKHNELLKLSGNKGDSYYNEYFTISKTFTMGDYFKTNNENFNIAGKIRIGATITDLDLYMKREPDCEIKKKGKILRKYYYYDSTKTNFSNYNLPNYVASFLIKKSKIIKFGLGFFFAEFDKEFLPRKLCKKQIINKIP